MKLLLVLAGAAFLTTPALSAACRDAKGKFIKCPSAAAAAMPGGITKDARGKCHASGGKFVACPK